MSINIKKRRQCQECQKETVHIAREDALAIEFECTECHRKMEIIKSFF